MPRRPGTPHYCSARRPKRQSETYPQPRVSCSGLARPGPARSNPATRHSPASPNPRPGSRVGPWLRRTGRHHVPRYISSHERFLIRSLSDPSPERELYAL
ncbi:hypothetical protein CHARACLAT_024611 [Characodon lateralis]|uniref:Uncharacterized protein n=1 Tax=Characodon lateralis TaxID=208331 RepID=A0ABU7D0I1_9TELE|nr:hypothetical protein [Characodon lateralis]